MIDVSKLYMYFYTLLIWIILLLDMHVLFFPY